MKIAVRALPLVALIVLAGGYRAEVSAQSSDGLVVAILPYSSSDEGKAKDLQRKILEGIDELGFYTLVDNDDVNDLLKEDGLKPGARLADTRTLELGRELGARIISRGTLEQREEMWFAKPVFVDVATRNMQELPEVSDENVKRLGEKVVDVFNSRNQADKHVIFGRDYIASENWDRAISNFEQALAYDPGMAAAYYYMGDAFLKQDRVDEALQSLQEAIDLDPAYISAYHSIGEAYLDKGDTTAARGFFEELIRGGADDCDIQIAFGYVMANQIGDLERGLGAFETAKSLCPENPSAYQYLAFALPADRREQKIENFKRYLELSEGAATDPEALEFLFGLYFAEEQYEEAKQTVDQARAADPDNADLQLYSGIVRSKLHEHADAIEFYTHAIELNSELDKAYLYRGLAHKEVGNMQGFADDLEKAGRGRSADILAGIFLRDAHALLQNGRTGPALEALSRAAQLGGDRCAIEYYRGDAYYKMGRALEGEESTIQQNERAREMFETAIVHLRRACGTYGSFGEGLVGNATKYLERIDLIIKKKSRSGR